MKLSDQERGILQLVLAEVAWPAGEGALPVLDFFEAARLSAVPESVDISKLSTTQVDYDISRAPLEAVFALLLTPQFKGTIARLVAPVLRRLKEALA